MFLYLLNDSLSCNGMDFLNEIRPTASNSFILLNIIISAFTASLFIVPLPFIFMLRNEPVYYKIRPFWLTLSFSIFIIVSPWASSLSDIGSPYFYIHCTGPFIIQGIGSSILATFIIMILFILIIETHYAQKAKANIDFIHYNNSFWRAFIHYLKLGFFIENVGDLNLNELANIRQNYIKISLSWCSLGFLICVLFISLVPLYHNANCFNCMMSFEFALAQIIGSGINIQMVLSYLYIAATKIQNDPQDIVKQMKLTSVFGSPCPIITYLLIMTDPYNIYLNRYFNWFLIVIGPGIWILAVFIIIKPLLIAIQQRREKYILSKTINIHDISKKRGDFIDKLNDNRQLKIEFYKYAESSYCMESLNFLEDVKGFKSEYSNHNEFWKRNKAKMIINTYVKRGAPQEINISSLVRNKIIEVDFILKDIDYFVLFNEAYEEIIWMIISGPFLSFTNEKRKQEKKIINSF